MSDMIKIDIRKPLLNEGFSGCRLASAHTANDEQLFHDLPPRTIATLRLP